VRGLRWICRLGGGFVVKALGCCGLVVMWLVLVSAWYGGTLLMDEEHIS
jgi:hypothetical protein